MTDRIVQRKPAVRTYRLVIATEFGFSSATA
jgi:hypothetical protein